MADYMEDAFGGWPVSGPDAPIKHILNHIFSCNMLETLAQFLSDTPVFFGREVSGITGDPGWSFDRPSPKDPPGEWPEGADYKAELDPEVYEAPHAFFMSRETLFQYIGLALPIYCARHPDKADKVRALFSAE